MMILLLMDVIKMKKLFAITVLLLLFSNVCLATVYYVGQNAGDGDPDGSSWAERYSLSTCEDGDSPFDDLAGHTVCLGGSIIPADGKFDLPDAAGASTIIYNGSATGDCSDTPSQAEITASNSVGGIYATNPNNLTITGFKIRNSADTTPERGIRFVCTTGSCANVTISNNDIQL